MSGDVLTFEMATATEGEPNIFLKKDWLQILDNQNREESLVANICLINLGSLYAEMGDYKTADFYYKKIIEISEKKLGLYLVNILSGSGHVESTLALRPEELDRVILKNIL